MYIRALGTQYHSAHEHADKPATTKQITKFELSLSMENPCTTFVNRLTALLAFRQSSQRVANNTHVHKRALLAVSTAVASTSLSSIRIRTCMHCRLSHSLPGYTQDDIPGLHVQSASQHTMIFPHVAVTNYAQV